MPKYFRQWRMFQFVLLRPEISKYYLSFFFFFVFYFGVCEFEYLFLFVAMHSFLRFIFDKQFD